MNAPGDAGAEDNCLNCCETSPPDDSSGYNTGYDTFINALLGCACGTSSAPGPCATTCGSTVCASTPSAPSSACVTCVNDSLQAADGGEGACYTAVDKACTADPNCVTYNNCANGCP